MNGRPNTWKPRRPASAEWGGGKVYVIDHVVTRPGRACEFVDRYLSETRPAQRNAA